MSFDILCQTFTEGQARINAKIKTLLTMYALRTYFFVLVSLAQFFFSRMFVLHELF